MNQKTTLEIIAPTVEEAIAQGLAQLGLTADAVSVEVLDAGNKGLFGLGKPQVRVRLTVTPPGGMANIQTESAQSSVPSRRAPNVGNVDAEAEASSPRRRGNAPQTKAERLEPKPEPLDNTQGKPAAAIQETEPQPEHDALLDRTESVVSKMLHLLDLEAQVSAHYESIERDGRRTIRVDIRGNDLSVLIGRRSETLSAFQYVASLIVGKEEQQFVQLVVDVEGYRDRRERQLVQMAKRMADQVAKSGRRQTLEPMPSAERRIIHIALRDHPDVKTESTGEEPYRKVMIIPKGS
ncbi:MAG TPA: RNA-binding cell elongation regulator Jag/EloR [Anaerolineales bacterium]|nr:RNA-binding cell elongation regulator Jag/EloR [Anaerolineales bacterium]